MEWPDDQYVILASPEGRAAPLLLLQRVDEPKQGKNRVHLDLYASDIEVEVERLIALGASRVRGPVDEHGASWIVMTDPEGNEFCVVLDLTA